MNKFKNFIKLILQIFFFISIFNILNAKNINTYYKADKISGYLAGILSLDDNEYANSYNFLKKLNGIEEEHTSFSKKYLYSMINLKKFNEAYKFSKKLERKKIDSFESNLIIGIYHLKNNDYNSSLNYFKKLNKDTNISSLQKIISLSLLNWSQFENIDEKKAKQILALVPDRFKNIKKIQNAFLHCYYDSNLTNNVFKDLINNKETDFARYNYFYANYLLDKGKKTEAKNVIKKSLLKQPRNLILNQFNFEIELNKQELFSNKFECKNISHVLAELFYITSNALSSETLYSISNFYLNIAKYLNPKFISFDTLYAENFYRTKNYSEAIKIYNQIKKKDYVYRWYASKQIYSILIKQKKLDNALKLLDNEIKNNSKPSVYELFDYAEFLKNNEQFSKSIKFYSRVLNLITKKHHIYAETSEGRGIAYERVGSWDKAENDLLNSLSVDPNQAYVINYLAYSWIEKGIKIEKSLKMLEKANDLKKNDGYITDSLGWALFKLKKFDESKRYLQLAVRIMPSDPVVNDHFGDSLWMNGNKIQARYYWKYVLNLKETDEELKKTIKNKLIFGPKI